MNNIKSCINVKDEVVKLQMVNKFLSFLQIHVASKNFISTLIFLRYILEWDERGKFLFENKFYLIITKIKNRKY